MIVRETDPLRHRHQWRRGDRRPTSVTAITWLFTALGDPVNVAARLQGT